MRSTSRLTATVTAVEDRESPSQRDHAIVRRTCLVATARREARLLRRRGTFAFEITIAAPAVVRLAAATRSSLLLVSDSR
jgi:hypothetical protein